MSHVFSRPSFQGTTAIGLGVRSKRPCRTLGRGSSTSLKELPAGIWLPSGMRSARLLSTRFQGRSAQPNLTSVLTYLQIDLRPAISEDDHPVGICGTRYTQPLVTTPYAGVPCFHALSYFLPWCCIQGLALDESICAIATSLAAIWLGFENVFLVVVFPFQPSAQHSPSMVF